MDKESVSSTHISPHSNPNHHSDEVIDIEAVIGKKSNGKKLYLECS